MLATPRRHSKTCRKAPCPLTDSSEQILWMDCSSTWVSMALGAFLPSLDSTATEAVLATLASGFSLTSRTCAMEQQKATRSRV